MKRIAFTVVATAVLLSFNAVAETPGADWISREEVTHMLEAAGYSAITGLKADDGYWEGKGVKNGTIREFKVDPHSGALTKEKIDD